ncbi:penicillin-binding protein 2 [Patescibacteria group bacterium]|nr:penicillin-binding protein 2 [Patescibacteria group bacterium]
MIWRFKLVLLLINLAFFLVILRLGYWQIVKAEELSLMGQKQYGLSSEIFPKRGEIKTSDEFSLAANKISYLVYANPKLIEDKLATSKKLAETLEIEEASISANLKRDLFWVTIAKDLGVEKKQQVEDLKIPGVGFEERFDRFYPEGSIAAQLLGFVGKDDLGENKGYFGIEGYYDRLLSGKTGKVINVRDAFGRPVLARVREISPKIDGSDLILNIDRAIQYLAEKKIKEGVIRYGAESGMVGIINPKTGEVIAIATYPGFDPVNFKDYDSKRYKNPFITDLYEPGSTFKPLVMSSAMDAGLVSPTTKCDICSGPVSIGGYSIETWNKKYYPNINMTDVIRHSDNTGMVFVGQKLGVGKFLEHLNKFGIGYLTGIDLQGEVVAEMREKDSWYPVDLATASFGQGISITPIELLSAISAIANEGKRMEPHVVKEIISPDGKRTKIKPKVLNRPISSETAKVMTEIMVNAVDKGESSWVKLKDHRIAGKTGTASIPIAGHYDPKHTIASFVGFGPAENPKFAMLVVFNRPKSSIYGAETAAPIFFSIAKELVSYYGIAPDR